MVCAPIKTVYLRVGCKHNRHIGPTYAAKTSIKPEALTTGGMPNSTRHGCCGSSSSGSCREEAQWKAFCWCHNGLRLRRHARGLPCACRWSRWVTVLGRQMCQQRSWGTVLNAHLRCSATRIPSMVKRSSFLQSHQGRLQDRGRRLSAELAPRSATRQGSI